MTQRGLVLGLTISTLSLGLAGCGGGSNPTTPRPTAQVALSASPDPIVGVPCTGCGPLVGEFESVTALTVRETAGVAATAVSVAMELRTDAGDLVAAGTFESDALRALAGTTRIPANGQLTILDVGVHYPGTRAGLAATLTYTFQCTDDNGHPITTTLAVRTTT